MYSRRRKSPDFSKVGKKKELNEAQEWFQASRPSSSRSLGPEVSASNYQWLKWNPTSTGNRNLHYKGDLIIKREEKEETEAGTAMAAAREVAAAGAAMAAVKLE